MRGAGGTSGGIGHFFLGLIMASVGFYLLLNAISVQSSFGFGTRLFSGSSWGHSWSVTSGMVLVPFIFGVGFIFYHKNNLLGWILTLGSLAALIFGVIISLHFSLRNMTAFELLVVLILCAGGLGLFFRSFKSL